jgi:peroxiredoxin Q/BCP
MIERGKKAPGFSVQNQDGDTVSLDDFAGKNIVLYFYPKDDTPGCTTEACEFRDSHSELKDLDAVVLGVSKDSIKSHAKFRDKYELPFHLLSDTELDIHNKYGTWVEKKMYGKKYMGTQRATFVIDSKGVVRHVFPNVKPKGHVEQVREALASL